MIWIYILLFVIIALIVYLIYLVRFWGRTNIELTGDTYTGLNNVLFMRTFDPRTIRILRGVLLVPHFERIGESYHWSEMSVIFDRVSNSSAISSSPFSFAIWKMRFSSLSVYDNE